MTFDPVNADPNAVSAFDAERYIEVGGDVLMIDKPLTVKIINEALQYVVELFPIDTDTHEAAIRLSKEVSEVEEASRSAQNSGSASQIRFPTDETHDRTDLLLFATHVYEIWLRLAPSSYYLTDSETGTQTADPETNERLWRVPMIRDEFYGVSDENRMARKQAAEELIVASISFRLNADEPFSIGARSVRDGENR